MPKIKLEDVMPVYEPQIVEVDLGDCREEWRGKKWPILVNPERREVLAAEKYGREHPELVEPQRDPMWVAPSLNLSPEDMVQFLQKDRAFVDWLIDRAVTLYGEYAQKKAPKPRS